MCTIVNILQAGTHAKREREREREIDRQGQVTHTHKCGEWGSTLEEVIKKIYSKMGLFP